MEQAVQLKLINSFLWKSLTKRHWYEINGSSQNYTWNGNLGLYEHAWVSLPNVTPSAGNNTLDVEVVSLNGGNSDTVDTRNTISYDIILENQGRSLPLREGFEGGIFPPAGWVQYTSGSLIPWDVDDVSMKDGNYSIANFNSALLFYNMGNREEFETPSLDLTTTGSPELRFDVAYNYHKYTPPYFPVATSFADTLEISISTDCGGTFTTLYKKGGDELKTFDQPITNALDITQGIISPKIENWRTEIIDLSTYSSNSEAIIKFSYISAQGGSINIDNISVDQLNGIKEPRRFEVFDLYPNPAKDYVMIKMAGEGVDAVNLYDLTGRKMLSRQIAGNGVQEIRLNTADLPAGVYFIEASGANGAVSQKLVISR